MMPPCAALADRVLVEQPSRDLSEVACIHTVQ